MPGRSSDLSLATLRLLLSPRQLSLRNAIRYGDQRWLYVSFAVMALLFWLGIFGTVVWGVQQFWQASSVGPVVARVFLEILLSALFVLLTFSSVITALSVFYISADLELLLGLPISRPTFHYARFADTLLQSSWMMVIFGLPVFVAAGYVAQSGWAYYLSILVAVPALLVIATSGGVITATFLVTTFPAHRARDLLLAVAACMFAAAFVAIRALRPEQLADTESVETIAAYLANIQVPAPRLFPARWAGVVLGNTLLSAPVPRLELGLLLAGAGASLAISRWATAWGFDAGWARAQEARAARFHNQPLFDHLARVLPATWRPIAAKELRVLVRDPSQWSQVFLLAGLCAVYIVSVRALPIADFPGATGDALRNALTFLNLGMGGFVMASIAARFQFTAVSREGKSWWVLRSAPVDPTVVLRAKAAFGIVPLFIVGEIVTVGGGWVMEAHPWLLAGEAFMVILLAWGLSGLAAALGAVWPDFNAENAARAASSPAAVFFMVLAMVLVFGVMGLLVLGAYFVFKARLVVAAVFALAAVALCLWAGWWPPRRAAPILWARGLS